MISCVKGGAFSSASLEFQIQNYDQAAQQKTKSLLSMVFFGCQLS